MMPKGWIGKTIEVGGLVLMERPMIFTQEARRRENSAAREAVLTKEAQLKSSREGDLGLGVELGMQRAADMVENIINRYAPPGDD